VRIDEQLFLHSQLKSLLAELQLLSCKKILWLRQTRTSEIITLVQRNLNETMNDFKVSLHILSATPVFDDLYWL
jgi:hypothetical protein